MSLYYIPVKYREKNALLNSLAFEELKDVSEKISKLCQLLEIPSTECNERRAACGELRELLRKYYPDCQLLMYGSSINGFGTKFSQLDLLFVPFPGYCSADQPCNKIRYLSEPIPDPASILSGEVSKDVLTKFNDWHHLKFIRNVYKKEKSIVKRLSFHFDKIPSLRVHMANYNLVCHVSGSERLYVFNSELLQFLSKLDPRVKPLVMAVTYWAKCLGFVKKSFFKSYAFSLLVIFFLQNISPPVLPSVKHLMDVAGFSRMHDGWETAFTTDEKKVPKSENKETIGELFVHFFEYYWNFDYVQNFICPYSGKITPVADLINSMDERIAKFEISAINIQDPFIHSENVCKMEGPKMIIKLALHTARQMLQQDTSSTQEKFHKLFDAMEYQRILDSHFDKYMFGQHKVCLINFDHASMVKFGKTPKNLLLWYKRATESVFDVLQYGLLIDCEITDKICWDLQSNEKQNAPVGILKNKSSVASQSDPYNLELLLSIQCVLYSRVWVGRKNVTDVTKNGGDELEEFSEAALKTEYTISKELVTANPSLTSRYPLLCFKCDCYRHTSPQVRDIVVFLKPLTLSREFTQVSIFLASYIPRTVKKILSPD